MRHWLRASSRRGKCFGKGTQRMGKCALKLRRVPMLYHSAFYRFVRLDDVPAVVQWLERIAAGLTGSVLVAEEGINGMLAGEMAALDAFEAALTADPRFANQVFKRTECVTVPFKRLKIRRKKEIVPLGIDNVDATQPAGINVKPSDWRALIDEPDVVLLDNRNSFEYRLGRFRNAIDPGVENFRDFPRYVTEHVDEWKRNGKRVAMYCTGGIRCEKTAVWMKDLGVDVYQLEGGILNYFKELPDAERDWSGECFVFDNRIALDTHLKETDTTLEDVYDAEGETWRLQRAKELDGSQ